MTDFKRYSAGIPPTWGDSSPNAHEEATYGQA